MFFSNLAKKKVIFSFAVLIAILTFLITQTKAAETSDAIAVRIMPNPNHYSIDTWYKQQGYQGAPQKLIVDGYEAVRDGRTVFINAANVEANKIYTNIYLISYNQDSNTKTSDILGQLVSHWKFNNNLNVTGQCSISKISCVNNADCPTDYICSTGLFADNTVFNTLNKGKCLSKAAKSCLVDADCPINLFCDSAKAKVTRDTKRLGQLGDIKEALKLTDGRDGRYPELAGGTYVPGNTLSVWPSWQETFWPKLSGLNLVADPINILGNCAGYDAVTCWNKDSKQFYQSVNGQLSLPAGSYAYLYSAGLNGINYNLCATFETNGLYDTAEGQVSKNACLTGLGYTNTSFNTPPKLVSYFLAGESGLEFNGYVLAVDDQNDAISWKIDTSYTSFSSWSSSPTLRASNDANQKRIYAATAGVSGNYPITLTLTDSRGLEAKYPLIIKLTANKPIIEADDVDYLVNPVLPLKYTFFAQSFAGLTPSKITMVRVGGAAINPFGFAGAAESKTEIAVNRFRVDRSVIIPIGTPLPTDTIVTYRVTATDEKNNVAQKDISINLKAEKPYLDFNCDTNARIGQAYPINGGSCFIGSVKDGNHLLSYQLSAPAGLNLNKGGDNVYLSGSPSATITATGSPVTITAINEYGVLASKTFFLKVNSYCGDGSVQTPNSEGKGGVYNDGVESCDGTSGTTLNIAESSAFKQYGCATKGPSTYPILDNNACIFASGSNGGGYCGDNICQFQVNGLLLENACNCAKDCIKSSNSAAATQCETPVEPPVEPPATSKCGDSVVDVGEECDGSNLNNKTCQDFNSNYSLYGLSCGADCKFVKTNCSTKSCYRNSDCTDSYVCKTSGLDTLNYYYCTGTQYSHGCNTAPFTTALKSQCAGSYLGLGGTFFSDAVVAASTKYTQCKTACESAKYENNNQDYCDWVVSNGRCTAPTNVITCTSFTYSNWRQCLLGIRYRDVLTQSPASCTGGSPEIWEACSNCGNGVIDAQEACDGTLFGTATCQNRTKKYWSGSLACSTDCKTIIEDNCSGYCGDVICQANYENNNTCATDCPLTPCTPKTCATLGATCGSSDNGCNSTINCGGCNDNDACTDDSCNTTTLKCSYYKNYYKNVACKVCGDGLCSTYLSETNAECPADCKAACLNNNLDGGEQCDIVNSIPVFKDSATCASINPSKSLGTLSCSNCQINSSNCSAPACTTNCTGKRCGELDGCGGVCTTNGFETSCTAKGFAGGSLTCINGVVGTSNCTCAANYYSNGTSCVACAAGKKSLAGSTSVNQCVDCLGDSDCSTGYYCQGVNSSFTSCNAATNNTCQRKCWSLLETDSVTNFIEGDTIYNNSYGGCSVTKGADDPKCNAPTSCPSNCNGSNSPVHTGNDSQQCWNSKNWLGTKVDWDYLRKYKCYHTQYTKHYYNNACTLIQGYTAKDGVVNANGYCVAIAYCGDGNCDAGEDFGNCSNDCVEPFNKGEVIF
jgi:hypothetical protein